MFDLDGVLVDAAPWHYQALSQALGVFGYHIRPEEHDAKYNGLPTSEKLRLLSAQTGFPKKLHGIVNELKQAYTERIFSERCQPSPAILDLMKHLKEKGFKIGLASNSRKSTVQFVVERMLLDEYFDVVISHEQVAKPKPAADIYLAAFEKLGVMPAEALIVEDSPIGVQAARASGAVVLQIFSTDQVNIRNLQTFLQSREARTEARETEMRGCLQILVPMAGEGTRFRAAGYEAPKPFIDVEGKPMIQWVTDNVRPKDRDHRFLFLCQKKQLDANGRHAVLDAVAPRSAIVAVPAMTSGAACTALLAVDALDENAPLLLANSDQWVDADVTEFLQFADETGCDGAILTFTADENKWSYALCDDDGKVMRVAEKQCISEDATVGIYYFKRAGDFIAAAKKMIAYDTRTNGEFYVCPVYNELIAAGKDIRVFRIQPSQMHGLGTPEDLSRFLQRTRGAS